MSDPEYVRFLEHSHQTATKPPPITFDEFQASARRVPDINARLCEKGGPAPGIIYMDLWPIYDRGPDQSPRYNQMIRDHLYETDSLEEIERALFDLLTEEFGTAA